MQTSDRHQSDLALTLRYTSRLGDNPWKTINRRTRKGRRVRAIVQRLLVDIPNRDDPLLLADVIGIAQLMILAADMRADPTTDPVPLIRLEGLIDRRVRRLGFARSRGGSTPAQSTVPAISDLMRLP
jgi:hypothetical protein